MKIQYKGWNNESASADFTESKEIEIFKVFNGVTFVSEDGERLSVCMRDNGFEVHYYMTSLDATDKEPRGRSGFDAGWFRFNAGVVNVPPYIGEPLEEGYTAPFESNLDHNRLEAWNRATHMVDNMSEGSPLESYRVGMSFGVVGSTVTAAEQRVSLIREVADWLLGKED